MKVSLSWLREYVEIPLSPAALIERLTFAGLEVSGVRVYGLPIPEGVRVRPEDIGPVWAPDKIVTAKVTKVEQHPNADKLKLVTLEYGAAPKVVVTGAPNISVGDSGQIVILALTGSVLFDGHATPKKMSELKPTQLRGVPSDAMVCSGFELGTTEDHVGIILLPADTPVGKPLAELMGDIVIEIDILPNMARCLAMLGVAREVAAIAGTKVREPDTSRSGLPGRTSESKSRPADGTYSSAPFVTVQIEHSKLSRRYAALLIEGVTAKPSPLWMQSRLDYAGMRPINNLVDVTNYVMLEYGQPLHAFDYDVLKKRAKGDVPKITVRSARAGETLKTLDNQDRKLSPEHLVIADEAGPIALAGVMGGLETEVTAATKNILLESANFDFVSIRRTAKAFDLPSEASLRFSRGIHPETVRPAGLRAASLLAELAGGQVAPSMADCYPAPLPPQVIELPLAEVKRILGIEIEAAEATRVLSALDFEVATGRPGVLKVTAPTNRVDIQAGAADLIEELARVSGYDRLPATNLADPLPAQLGNRDLALEERVRDLLVGNGLQEFICYSLTTPEREAPLAPPPGEYVKLLNPISVERSAMRHTLLAGVLECTAANLRNTATVRAFEIGPVYFGKTGGLPDEPSRLAIVLTGHRNELYWTDSGENKELDFFELKGIVESLVADLHLTGVTFRLASSPHLHPGKAAELSLNGKSVGTFGELHPKACQAFDLGRRTVLVGEFDLAAILAAVPDRFQFTPVARFPAALRDVAVIVAEDVSAEKISGEIRAGGGELLAGLRLFDLYRGPSIPAGTKSLAYALTYQASDRTLSDKEIDKAHKKIEDRLKHVLKAQIRGKEAP
ncbi:MAG: phenylalanine--tRNA ligase subunit beta [Gemmataceae bacterium]